MRLTRQKKSGSVVGLNIEAGTVAATQVTVNGAARVTASAIGPLEAGAFREGEVIDGDGLVAALKALFAEHKLSRRVRLGVGNQRVIVRTLRLPAIEDPRELEAAVRFQAQEQIPMPLDQAVLEYQVVGGVPAEEGSTPQLDVVVVAARRDMIFSFLTPLRSAGLEPVGVDLSAFAMIRALAGTLEGEGAAGADGEAPTRPLDQAILYCNIGDVTNLAVARGRACLFARVSYVGLEAIAGRLISSHGLTPETATHWLQHVGLGSPLDEIEGDPGVVAESRQVLEEGVAALGDELRLSLDYYGTQEAAVPVERIVLSGAGSAIPGLAQRLESLDLPISLTRPPALAGLDDVAASRLTLPYGLALEA